MIETIVFIGGVLSGRAERRATIGQLPIDRTILREFTEYRLAGSAETTGGDEIVYVYYASDVLPCVRESHKQSALNFMSTVAISSSAAVAMTMWLCSMRQYTFCVHAMHEIATDHVDAFCKIALASKRVRRLHRKGLQDLTGSQLFGMFRKSK